jgi:GNAT superfamily N-acetyltransferase
MRPPSVSGGDAPASVRLALPADAPALARLRYEFRAGLAEAAESEAAFVERCTAWMDERLHPDGTWRCWVAEAGKAIVGNAWLLLLEKLPNPVAELERHGYISNLYVQPVHRGRGLGSALLTECLREADAMGVDALILWPTPRSRSLYIRHGFAARDDLMERRG